MKSLISFIFVLSIFGTISCSNSDFEDITNIENCLSLNIGDSKERVLDVMGTPNVKFNSGMSLQYHPTRAFSSCQVVLTFEPNESGEAKLVKKFCDDGKVYKCAG